MSTVTDYRDQLQVEVNWRAITLAALFGIVILGALALRPYFVSEGVSSAVEGTSTSGQAATGFGWALAEAAFAALVLGVLLLYRRLPEWVQDTLKTCLALVLWMYVGVLAARGGAWWMSALFIAGAYAVYKVIDHYDVFWIFNNLTSIGLAIVAGAIVGIKLGPWVLATGLIGLSVYDHVFADKKSWMFTMGAWFLDQRIPVLVVVPKSWRLDWDELADGLRGDEEGDEEDRTVRFGIGTADLLLPAAFVVAVVNTLPAAGASAVVAAAVIAGILLACFNLSWKMSAQGSGAGLPPLCTGALGGWVVGTVVVMAL